MFGSDTDDTSASMRFVHFASVCQLGFAMYALQPLPPLFQAVSAHPRDELLFERDVPPTASTVGDVAGKLAP